MTIIKHELKQNIKTLLIWSIILGGLTFSFMLMFPSIKGQMGDMVKSYANMGSFSAAFGIDKINFATAMGFYGIEAGTMIAIGGAMFSAMLGSVALSKEESNHTAEFLLTHPISRVRVVAEKLISVILQVTIFNIICFCCAIISFAIIGEDIEIKNLILFHIAQLIMHLEIMCICFAISAFGRHANVGMGLGFAAILYFMNLFVNASSQAKSLKYVTPFQYSDAAEIFPSGHLDSLLVGIGVGIAIISICIAFFKYTRKDIAV